MATIAERAVATPASRPATAPTRGPRIGVIYPSGWGNLGDEAILKSTFEMLRERWPHARIRAFTLNPARTSAHHGVEADALTGVSKSGFLANLGEGPFVVRAARGVARRTRSIPGVGNITALLASLVATVVFESQSLRRTWNWLRDADLVLAAGGGQLDAVWGGAWGQPYALARWAWMSRRAGVPFAFLSVGFGGAKGLASRTLLRYAVNRASYCSLRDSGSRDLTRSLKVGGALPVVPDLAFRLRARAPLKSRRPGLDVGISPMTFLRPGTWPTENAEKYQRLIGLWADVAARIVGRGDRVHFFVSDPVDMNAVLDVWAKLPKHVISMCTIVEAKDPDELLDFFRGIDVAIASRLHGVLLAVVAGKPVLALSHERKVRAVMSDAGATKFCLDLEKATSADVDETFFALSAELESSARQFREYTLVAQAALRQQEDFLPHLLRTSR